MTYTGAPRLAFAHELPGAHSAANDIWLRTDTGDEVLVLTATRNGDVITVTADLCDWPAPSAPPAHITIHLAASARISTRIY